MLEAQKLSIKFATLPRLLSMFHFYYRSIAIAALISRLIDSSMYCYSLKRKGLKGCEPVQVQRHFHWRGCRIVRFLTSYFKSLSNDGGANGSKTLTVTLESRGTQREYSSKPLNIALLNVFQYLNGIDIGIFLFPKNF